MRMLREEAIEALTSKDVHNSDKMLEALDMAIKVLEQEPCEDCCNGNQIEKAKLCQKSYLAGMEHKQEPKWIPVSERLPEKYRFVNCTCHSLIDDREDWVVETVYIPQPSNSPYSDWGNIPILNWKQAEVVAWMYRDIPKPYKAESEVKE